ncbi:MAG TPA: M50 family metallopeptidase [Candidatus Saccharimonadales bacterium]|nr:M50 family metallopeptidase [Candidatus Saccharimonadales bacterium]
MSILLLIVGVVLFIGLVLTHEYGHFIMAKRGGVKVEEFGLFFPPRLYKHKTRDGWLFSINLLPLGGFVKLKGEHDTDTSPGSYGAASLKVKTKIMAAGVVINIVTGLVLFTILALIGMPRVVDHQFTVQSDTQLVNRSVIITYVEPGSPAAKAGLHAEDELTDIARPGYSPVATVSSDGLRDVTQNFAGETVVVYYLRAGQPREAKLTMLTKQTVQASLKTNHPKGYLGVEPTQLVIQRSTWSAPVVAVGLSAQITALTFQGLGHAFAGLGSAIAGAVTGNHAARENGQTAASSQVSGPVGIAVLMKDFSSLGYQFVLFFIAYIALILGIMNILPIPALDGGRLWLTLISRAVKRPLSAAAEETVNAVGFIILFSLIILITIVDVQRFF